MTSKMYLTISSIISFVYGLSFLFLPSSSLEFYGVTPEPHVNAALMFFGTSLLTLALVTWFGREFDWQAMQKVMITVVLGNALSTLLTILEWARGIINAASWVSVLINVLFIIGGVYFLMNDTASTSDARRSAA
jgi:hypothetical protein